MNNTQSYYLLNIIDIAFPGTQKTFCICFLDNQKKKYSRFVCFSCHSKHNPIDFPTLFHRFNKVFRVVYC